MLKCFIVQVLLVACFYNSAFASENMVFFPKDITNEINADLTKFLKSIPKNKGQLSLVNRIIEHEKRGDILILIKPTFSITEIKRLLKNDDIFMLIEMIDIISVNLNSKHVFSNWYFSNIVSLARNCPSSYMNPLIVFCSKADGMYAEWFADPLLEIIEQNPFEFLEALKGSKVELKICGILKSGDQKKALELLNMKFNSNAKENNKSLNFLLKCLSEH